MGYKDNHKSEYVSDIISNEAIRNMHEIEWLSAHTISKKIGVPFHLVIKKLKDMGIF